MLGTRWSLLVTILVVWSSVLAQALQGSGRQETVSSLDFFGGDAAEPFLASSLEAQTKTIKKIGSLDTSNLARPISATDPAAADARRSAGRSGISKRLFFYPDATWTNQTMVDTFCAQLSSDYDLLFATFDGVPLPEPLLMPDCFYDRPEITFTYYTLYSLIFQGNETYPDPLVRLGLRTSNSLGTLISNSRFAGPNGEPYIVQWDNVFPTMPVLRRLVITNSQLQGVLPTSIPAAMTGAFILTSNLLSGPVPATLLSNLPSSATGFTLDLSKNAFSGEIPSTLFDTLPYASLTSLTVALDGNSFSGNLPPFAQPFTQLTTFKYTAANASFSGGAQTLFSSSGFPNGGLTSFYLDASNNAITGAFPASAFASNYASTASFYLAMNNNGMTGSLPNGMMSSFTSNLASLSTNFANNALTGTVPSDLLTFGATGSTMSVATIMIDLDNNRITGALPSAFFSSIVWTSTSSFILGLNNNLISGDLPSTLLGTSNPPALKTLQVSMNGNPNLSGTIPASFLASINPITAVTAISELATFSLSFSQTALTGTLTIPDFTPRKNVQATSLSLGFASTNLRRLIIDANAGAILASLDISGDSLLTGTLPTNLFSSSSLLTTLLASHVPLGGALPDTSSANFASLDLSSTYIDFCSSGATLASTECNLNGTNANQCPDRFPQCATSAVDNTPATTTTCSLATRPSTDYICIGSSWTLYGTVEAPTLTIPGGSSAAPIQTVVIGNVASTTLVLGRGSSLIIQSGCASNLSDVTIELNASDLDSIDNSTQTLLSIDIDSTCTNLSAINLNTAVNGKSCKNVTATRIETSSQLVALFSIDSSGCKNGGSSNKWWIIVVAVVVPVVVVVLIVVLLVALVRPVRECILPYSKRRHATGRTMPNEG